MTTHDLPRHSLPLFLSLMASSAWHASLNTNNVFDNKKRKERSDTHRTTSTRCALKDFENIAFSSCVYRRQQKTER